MIFEDFTEPLDNAGHKLVLVAGNYTSKTPYYAWHLSQPGRDMYTDAQIDDYGNLQEPTFPGDLHLRLNVVARSSLPAASLRNYNEDTVTLQGTAGFGFWNYPFSVKGDILMLPEAIWFFYASPPSNMALVPGIPGWGWKAQVVHSMQSGSLAATVPLAATIAFGVLTGKTRPAARWMQKVSGACEATFASRDE